MCRDYCEAERRKQKQAYIHHAGFPSDCMDFGGMIYDLWYRSNDYRCFLYKYVNYRFGGPRDWGKKTRRVLCRVRLGIDCGCRGRLQSWGYVWWHVMIIYLYFTHSIGWWKSIVKLQSCEVVFSVVTLLLITEEESGKKGWQERKLSNWTTRKSTVSNNRHKDYGELLI